MDITILSSCAKYLAMGLGIGISTFGVAIGLGMATKMVIEGIARQPEAESQLSKYFFIGAGLIEACAIYTIVIALLIAFVVK